ncbi:MAG: 30S ribosomal protein S12 methylthiotransferase RimO [Acidimicrobiales bacterium]
MGSRFHLVTLGCPKNQVDSDKLTGALLADGYQPASALDDADLVVVNTCAFVEEARQESVDTILELAEARRPGARLVVTGCLAERSGAELAGAIPEIDEVAGFADAVPVTLGRRVDVPALDLLRLPRPAPSAPWAYVKVAEGCDRACGFCAIPSFRGPQRSRATSEVLVEVEGLAAAGVREVVLVAQDLVSYGRDQGVGTRQLVPLVEAAAARVPWVRLLYVYPSDLSDDLERVLCDVAVPYVDLSLQHVSRPLLRRMRRWGDGDRFLRRIDSIRSRRPDAAFRSNFIVGYPGETEADHDALLAFVEQAQLDWCGFFAYSEEAGTYSAELDGKVPTGLVRERLAELSERQDAITAAKRDELVGSRVEVLVDEPGVARGHREAPEIDGVVAVPRDLPAGTFQKVLVEAAEGPDLRAVLS